MAYPHPVAPLKQHAPIPIVTEKEDYKSISDLNTIKIGWSFGALWAYVFRCRYYFSVSTNDTKEWTERVHWCCENLKPSHFYTKMDVNPLSDVIIGRFFFKRKEDALFFKLTWS